MSKLLEADKSNAEGYCKKCGTELGIEGRCYVCAVRFLDLDDLQSKLGDVFTCKICGQPKYHSRLHGYRCWNPEHNREEA